MTDKLLWYVGRAGGLTAWWLAGLSVLVGLLLSTRVTNGKPRPAKLLDLHRFLGGLAVMFAAVHVAALVSDRHARLGWEMALVPFASRWRPGALAWGIVAIYLLVAVELTSLVRGRIPKSWWRAIHSTAFIVFGAGSFHALRIGSDSGNPAVQWSGLVMGSAFTFLVTYRALVGGRAPVQRKGGGVPVATGEAGD